MKVEEDRDVEDELRRARELVARRARELFGDHVPEAAMDEEEWRVYERMFGKPVGARDGLGSVPEEDAGTVLLRERKNGELEEVEVGEEEELDVDNEEMDEEHMMEDDYGMPREPNDTVDPDDGRPSRHHHAESEAKGQQDEEPFMRTHPWTQVNRFATNPTTITLPEHTMVNPATVSLSGMPAPHLEQAALRIFGGSGLPYSTSTPNKLKIMQHKPIALDAYQSHMSEMEGHVYIATLLPAIYASVTSVLSETRKRLGTRWAEELVRKANAGELRILDAGGAGAGIFAVREMLRAEWERMHKDTADAPDSILALAEADGKIGGAGASPPLGHATVLAASDVLRRKAGQLLENTTFLPRLPDYLHSEVAKEKGKFDIIIAPHTILPLEKEYMRKRHVQNLWNLLSAKGGVLVMLEKGIARGFEAVAAAREMLLDTTIASPGSEYKSTGIADPAVVWEGEEGEDPGPEPLTKPKETGMIIAPCTNHASCPMYHEKGIVKGRKDICCFEQRYVRPPFMQKILQSGAKAKNFEDVEFSYVSVMRGRDMRSSNIDHRPIGHDHDVLLEQGTKTTSRAFDGLPNHTAAEDITTDDLASAPHSLGLPRLILPPLKRKGHIILDVCTSDATLERWTVPRSYSKQAFRDARKSSWGDLWALGAKTRNVRSMRQPKHGPDGKYARDPDRQDEDKKPKAHERRKRKDEEAAQREEMMRLKGERRAERKEAVAAQIKEEKALARERLKRAKEEKKEARPSERGEGGRMRTELIKGVRDKRDKKGGAGRNREDDE